MVADGNHREGHISGLGAGHVHPPDGLPQVCAVNARRLAIGAGHGFEGLPQQKNGHSAAQEGEHDSQLGIDQSHFGKRHEVRDNQHIVGDNDLHKDDHKHEGLAPVVHKRQRISRQRRRNKLNSEGDDHQNDRIQVVLAKGHRIPHVLDIFKGKFRVGQKGHMERSLGQRRAHQPDQGRKPDQTQQNGKERNDKGSELSHAASPLS